MTPNEYRKKHKRCATCKYFCNRIIRYRRRYNCLAKDIYITPNKGKFCRVYKPRGFKE